MGRKKPQCDADENPIVIWSWWWEGKERPAGRRRWLKKSEWLEHLQRISPHFTRKKAEIERMWADYQLHRALH